MSTLVTSSGLDIVHAHEMPFWAAGSAATLDDVARVAQSGINADVSTASAPEDVWSGAGLGLLNGIDHKLIQFPNGAISCEIVSDSASDTAAGAGMRTAQITYLDSNWETKSAVIVMSGTTPVAMPEPVRAINLFARGSVGTYRGANVGNVSIRAAGGAGATYSYMLAGQGIAQSSGYVVPAGFTLLFESVVYSINRTATTDRWADFSIHSMNSSGALLKSSVTSVSTSAPYRASGGVLLGVVPERTAIWVNVDSVSGNNTSVTGIIYGLRIANSRLEIKG
jgi:hypothetical protein